MKKILLTLVFVLCGMWQAGAQKIDVEEFIEIGGQKYSEMGLALSEGDYAESERLSAEIFGMLGGLDKEDQEKLSSYRGYVYYDLACTYSLWGKPEEAVDAFSKAIDNGYNNYSHAKQDEDFDPIRELPEFQKQIERLKEYDYLTILQKSRPYRKDLQQPEFTYQSPDAEMLVELREKYDLDAIAGDGDEVSQMKNIMTWLHQTVCHDGSHNASVDRNAIALITYAQENDRGVNCRNLAIILNELYLAMGWPSRFITCLPNVEKGGECHVINVVYSNSLNKWIWMDPSFDVWMSDENGNLLSIQEVRERVINDQPLLVNPEANWNGRPYTKTMYMEGFMLDYLYWFQCSAWSGTDVETWYEGKTPVTYVSLCPSGFYGFDNPRDVYVTNDPDYFWQKPQ